jgi:hypothetical protein
MNMGLLFSELGSEGDFKIFKKLVIDKEVMGLCLERVLSSF